MKKLAMMWFVCLAVAAVTSSTRVEAEDRLSKCELKAIFGSGAHPNFDSEDRKFALTDAGEQEKLSRGLLVCEYDPDSDGQLDALSAARSYAFAAIEYWSTDHIAEARRVSALGTTILRRMVPRTHDELREVGEYRSMFVCASQNNCVGWGPKAH